MCDQSKIVCVYPPYDVKAGFLMGLPFIATYLFNNGFRNITIIDAPNQNLTHEQVVAKIKLLHAKAVLVSVPFTSYTDSALKLLKMLKKEVNALVFVGGVMVTVMPQLFTDYADVTVVGAGEKIVYKVLTGELAPSKIMYGGKTDWNCIPFIRWELCSKEMFNKHVWWTEQKILPTILTFGCPFSCQFCVNSTIPGKVSFRNPENVADEIEHYMNKFRVKCFEFYDECFTLNRKLVLEFCRIVQQRNLKFSWGVQARINMVDTELVMEMKKAGCVCVQFGVEAGNPAIRKRIGKTFPLDTYKRSVRVVREAGMLCYCGFIIGHPDETVETINETAQFPNVVGADAASAGICTPFPGTRLRNEIDEGQIVAKTWSDYRTSRTTYVPYGLVNCNLEKTCELLNIEFSSWKRQSMERLIRQKPKLFLTCVGTLLPLFLAHKIYRKSLCGYSVFLVPTSLTRKILRIKAMV